MNSKQVFKNVCIGILLAFIVFILYVVTISGWDLRQIRMTGKNLGLVSALFFCITITPGIVRRSNINFLGQIPVHLLYARAQLGLIMFFTALGHYLMLVIVPILKFKVEPKPQAFFIFGLLALFLSFWLALTSNQLSKKILKKHWKTLHALVYIIVWLIFLHTVLIDVSPISILVGLFAIAETASLIYDKSKKVKVN
jgi:DMSO/TMAO reductase YedYZ heme-binding membrane subunit